MYRLIALLILIAPVPTALAPPQQQGPSLPPNDRSALLSSVLRERIRVFGDSMLVDRCSLAAAAHTSPDSTATLDAPLRGLVADASRGGCGKPMQRVPPGSWIIEIQAIRADTVRRFTGRGLAPDTNAVTVRLRAGLPQSASRLEEYTMRRDPGAGWVTVSIRLFGFEYH